MSIFRKYIKHKPSLETYATENDYKRVVDEEYVYCILTPFKEGSNLRYKVYTVSSQLFLPIKIPTEISDLYTKHPELRNYLIRQLTRSPTPAIHQYKSNKLFNLIGVDVSFSYVRTLTILDNKIELLYIYNDSLGIDYTLTYNLKTSKFYITDSGNSTEITSDDIYYYFAKTFTFEFDNEEYFGLIDTGKTGYGVPMFAIDNSSLPPGGGKPIPTKIKRITVINGKPYIVHR